MLKYNIKLEKFFEKKHSCGFIFRTGLYTFPPSKYKRSTLYSNMCQMSLHTVFQLSSMF